MPGDAPSDLDGVDVGSMRGVGEFERGVAGFQDGHPPAGRGIGRALGQAKHVTVERQRLVGSDAVTTSRSWVTSGMPFTVHLRGTRTSRSSKCSGVPGLGRAEDPVTGVADECGREAKVDLRGGIQPGERVGGQVQADGTEVAE